jgi:hypothetical protein
LNFNLTKSGEETMKIIPMLPGIIALIVLNTASVLAQQTTNEPLGFFVTSSTQSGNLGGLSGADNICQSLASNVGAGNRTWRAYLSTHGTPQQPAVNARERIGNGPWFNAKGVMIAASVADLHGDIQRDSNLIFTGTAITEKGELVNARIRLEGTNNEHDILTGSDSHGRAFPPGLASGGDDRTCKNWTYGGTDGSAMIGHHDRQSSWNTSWNSSHSTRGCSLENFNSTGGAGRFYCFAAE